MPENRRDFLKAFAAAGAAITVNAQPGMRIVIATAANPSFKRRLAERELLRGVARLLPKIDVRLGTSGDAAALTFTLALDPSRFKGAEEYEIASTGQNAVLLAAPNEHALLYAVFDFLERQGAFFGIDGPSYAIDRPESLVLPPQVTPWKASPRFAVRGLLPWPDFLNCITVYNDEDFRAYFESMLRMRFNTFGMHVYTGANQWAESYLNFEFAGVGHLAFLDNSASHRWGYLPQRTSRYGMGAAQFYDSEVFGSDSTRLARDPWEAASRARKLLRDAYAHAARLGIRTGIGFEPYQIPDEILRALPPEAKPNKPGSGPRFDIESVTAKDLLEARLANLLESYPEVDYVWLWEDENMNWESRKTGQPFSVTPFLTAHSFLKRHAPKKRLVMGGWGGVARHFEDFHKRLPLDIVFTCLSDSLGWDPVHEAFGNLEGRERWPIPWIEDDPAMWLMQPHVHRFERDLNLAAQYGCQGLLGIHWRHRIVDPVAGYQARFSWDAGLKPAPFYETYARTQAFGASAAKLASVLTDADKNRKLLSTGTDEIKDGHVVTREYTGDYNEAFTFWNNYEPDARTIEFQRDVADALRAIANGATTPLERERLEYLTKHVEFMVPYADAWVSAHRLQAVLDKASKLPKAEARDLVRNEGVPLWLKIAPEVRDAILAFQSIVSTRNDLGTLASMHNKFVRLALVRLRMSLKEYLGELPPEVDAAAREAVQPDPKAPVRVFVPTRPTLLAKGEKVRVMAVAAGPSPASSMALETRIRGGQWTASPARLMGRRTYEAVLAVPAAASELMECRFSAVIGGKRVASESWDVTLV